MPRLWRRAARATGEGIEVALAGGVERASVDLKLRVIVVTTRAALRHADGDPGQTRAIIDRGRSLLETLATDEPTAHREAIDQAVAELEALATDG